MTLTSGLIDTLTEDGIGWLVWNNPTKLNAISADMMIDAAEVLLALDAEPDVKVVVMRGAGEKAFISGGDISKFKEVRADAEAERRYREIPERLQAIMTSLGKPLIAMIHGYCLGGGMSMALSADLRFGATTAKLGIPATKRGIAYPASSLTRLRELIGPSRAKDLMFTARHVPAEEALQMGLLNRVFPPEDLERETIAYARTIADNAPLSVRAAKYFIDQVGLEAHQRDSARMQQMSDACVNSEDFKEATKSFLEKRKPVFRGV
jgi:enoyl-CoA hydratase/carnithine racemase